MAPQVFPPVVRIQQSLRGLQPWFPLVLYGMIGTLSTYIATHHNLDMVSDQIRATYTDRADTFDFIVVGAGSAGAVVANRLSEDYNVLLLEAGGEPNPFSAMPGVAFLMLGHKEIDWLHKTVPQRKACLALPHKQSGWSQGLGLGGTSNLNFLIYLRGHTKDYDYWANITGDPSWSFDGVMPFYTKAENYNGEWDSKYHGHSGEMRVERPPYAGMGEIFVQAAQDMGYPRTDLNAPFKEGFSPIYMPMKDGRRGGTYKVFLEKARQRPSLTIYKFAHVNKVLLRGPNNEAYGVEYERHGIKKIAYAHKEVIVSAGAIQSPKILMLSGIGPRKHLEQVGIKVKADLPVGQNLQDHISTYLGPFFVDKPVSTLLDRDINMNAFLRFVRDNAGPLTSPGTHGAGFIATKYAKEAGQGDWPDVQFIMLGTGVYEKMDVDFAKAFHVDVDVMKKYMAHAKGKDSFQIITSLARPLARGDIKLRDANPRTPQLIDPKYLEHDKDIKVLIEGVKTAVLLAENTTTMQNLGSRFTDQPFPGCEDVPFRTDAYWECYIRHYSITLHHIVGSCSMGRRGSKEAVVDPELRVIGTQRLRVIDASVMPLVPISNTHAPSVMIGEKGAFHIKNTWQNSNSNNENNDIIR